MSKINKICTTLICSLVLISSLTIFTNKNNIVKADVNLTRNDIATLIFTYLTKLGLDFGNTGYSTAEQLIDTFSGLMIVFESATSTTTLTSSDFSIVSDKKIEFKPSAITYCKNFLNYINTNYNLSSTSTNIQSQSGIYNYFDNVYVPICTSVPNHYDSTYFNTASAVWTITGLDSLNPSSWTTVSSIKLANSDEHTYNLQIKEDPTDVEYRMYRITRSAYDSYSEYSFVEFYQHANRTTKIFLGTRDYSVGSTSPLIFTRMTSEGQFQASSTTATLTAPNITSITKSITAVYNVPTNIPNDTDYGALVLKDVTTINNLNETITTLNNALKNATVSNVADIAWGETFADALDNINEQLDDNNSLLLDIKNMLANFFNVGEWFPNNNFISDITALKSFLSNKLNDLFNNLNNLNTSNSDYTVPNNIKTQLTSINNAVFGGFFDLLFDNGLGIIVFMGLIMIILGIVL